MYVISVLYGKIERSLPNSKPEYHNTVSINTCLKFLYISTPPLTAM
ncbi:MULTISPECIES: hypothetical protein [Nostocales]|nr:MULTISPECIES: hypothetical protein [Nostocales]MBD2270566.1 hypothetical protein [Anabaena sp. FACHB-1391]